MMTLGATSIHSSHNNTSMEIRSHLLSDTGSDTEASVADRGPATTCTKLADERRISVRDVQVNGDRDVLPSGRQIVASYNWSTTSTSEKPHIIAPGTARVFVSPSSKKEDSGAVAAGAPRLYVPPRGRGFTLSKYGGVQVVDENASMMHPFSSMEPLFHSLEICAPGFDMSAIDVVTDRNNLRKLLRFCDSPGSRCDVWHFRGITSWPE